MSYDRQINQICPHVVTEEVRLVGADRQTIRPLRPIASTSSVAVRLNGEIDVPWGGLGLPGKGSGTRRGPFSFTEGVNNLIQYRVDQGTVRTITLPTLHRVSTQKLVAMLNRYAEGLTFSVINDRVAFEGITVGRQASVFLLSGTTAATTLGLTANHEYRGQDLIPGWTLVSDPLTLSDRPTRLVVFDTPLRATSNYAEISYSTVKEECRRCGGSGMENDWRFDVRGEVIPITGADLLIQEIQKIFYTQRGSNPFHASYGASLLDAIGKKITANSYSQNLISADLQRAFTSWQRIKIVQETLQAVTDEEFPYRLVSVNVKQSTKDPTVIFVDCTIQNRSNQPIQLTRGLKLPAALTTIA